MMNDSRIGILSKLSGALRGRAIKDDANGSPKQKGDAAEANVAAGLKPQQLTEQERHLFGSQLASYLRARKKILLKWYQDCEHQVNLQELLDDADDKSVSVTRDAYYFLQENGYINFGVLQGREPTAQHEAVGTVANEQPQEQQQKVESEESEAAIVLKLYDLLRVADMETTSEKALRKELQKHFKTDISTRKALVKEHVNYFIQHLEQKATLKPKGHEGLTHAATAADMAKARKQAAAKAKREAAAAPLLKPAGRVVVVGAGPAGLAAAVLMQRNGVDVVVLEARGRVGGRVHSYTGDFSAPVELGAWLVTDSQPDTVEGQALDPVAVVCKQLGIQLHQLKEVLPCYDATGCQVSKDLDTNVGQLRDHLVNCSLAAADEEGAAEQSLGQVLQQALEQRLKAAAAAAPSCNSPLAGQHQRHQVDGATQPEEQHETTASQQQQQSGWQRTSEPTEQMTRTAETRPALPPGLEQTPTPDAGIRQTYAELLAAAAAGAQPITADVLDVLDWHWAYLEYLCGGSLYDISLPHWEQGVDWSSVDAPHRLVAGGLNQAMQGLAKQLGGNLHLSTPVRGIEYTASDNKQQLQSERQLEAAQQHDSDLVHRQSEDQGEVVRVTTASGEVYECSAVVVTLPLGVLKAGSVEFVPPLPDWKLSAVHGLGFGDLNKVIMQFPTVFWEDVDCFGITQPAGAATRGRCFMFWSLARCTGVPLLTALVSGSSARAAEDTPQEDMVQHMVQALRRVYGEAVPEPVASYATRWASDEFSCGSHSHVAVGCSGAEYDMLAAPVSHRVLFAGEHTCKQHPATVKGAMLSGMREAARALHLLRGTSAATSYLGNITSRSEVQGDEEEHAAVFQPEGAAEGQALKKTREPTGEKKERKAKRQKMERKPKARSDAERSDDEDLKHGGQRGVREQRPAAMSPAEMQSQLQQRQHMQTHLNRLWRGFIDAQSGDVHTVLDVLNNCSSLEQRHQCVAAVMKAPAEAVQVLSEHAKFLEVIFSWLNELLPERSDANLHVTKKLLDLLAKLTSSWAAITAVPDVIETLKAASEHRNKEVAKMGAAVKKSWMSRNPSKPNAQESAARRRISSAGQRSAASKPGQQQAQQPRPAPDSAATCRGDVGGADKLAELVDADSLQELEQAQAALQAAKEQAAREAALLAAMQREPLLPHSGRMHFDTFGEYSRVAKRHQQGAEDEAVEQQAPGKRSKQPHHRRHQQKVAAVAVKQRPGSGSGTDAKDAGIKELRDFIKSRLKPRFQSKELDQEICIWVLQRVQEKVLKNTTALEVAQGGFLTGKRAKKVTDLVDNYVNRRKADISRELKLAAAKAASTAGVAAGVPLTTAAAPPKPPTRSKWDQPS